jgi:hypothetical protein
MTTSHMKMLLVALIEAQLLRVSGTARCDGSTRELKCKYQWLRSATRRIGFRDGSNGNVIRIS